jgi:hypothetical protein
VVCDQPLSGGLLRELNRLGVTKPMRHVPGVNLQVSSQHNGQH